MIHLLGLFISGAIGGAIVVIMLLAAYAIDDLLDVLRGEIQQ